MPPTIEDVKRVAEECGFGKSSIHDDWIANNEELQAFAHHWIEVGRKEQRENDDQVSDGIYQDRVDDNLALCEALRAVYTICGEDEKIKRIVHEAISEHGIDDC